MLSNRTCQPIAQYPLNLTYASGALLQGKPIICGGYSYVTREHTPECFMYDLSTNTWIYLTSLGSESAHHASIEVQGSLWVTGGGDGRFRYGTTQFVNANGSVLLGPYLPVGKEGREGHCMVDLGDGRVMLTGGKPTFYDVSIYESLTRSFARGPSFEIARSFHTCAVFHSPLHGLRPVVLVAGGNDEYGAVHRSVQVLDFTDTSAVWQDCEY